jgi:competence protein ComEC
MIGQFFQSKNKTFLAFCFSFLTGTGFASAWHIQTTLLLASLCVTAMLAFVCRKKRAYFFIVICFLFCVLGAYRYVLAFERIGHAVIESEVTGIVTRLPDIRTSHTSYIVESQKMHTTIYLFTERYPAYTVGTHLTVTCDFQPVNRIEPLKYRMYLRTLGVDAVCYRAQYVARSGDSLRPLTPIADVRRVVAAQIETLWHSPYSGFMAGLLYGYRGGLGFLEETFSRTGLTHIIAISGYNISIIAALLISLFIQVRVPRKRAFWGIAIGIGVFVLFVGASASVVRAGIMGVLVLFARKMGRQHAASNLLIFCAVVMVFHNPFVFIWDIGFQLSFLATFGLIRVSPSIDRVLALLHVPSWLREPISATCAATYMTLPLIAYHFGKLSLVSVAANIAVLWMIPIIMCMGALSLMLSFVWPTLGVGMSYVSWVCMEYVIQVATWAAATPFALVSVHMSLGALATMYAAYVFFAYRKCMCHVRYV